MPSSRKSNRSPGARPAAAKPPLKHRRGGLFSMDSEQSSRMVIFGVTAVVLLAAAAFIAIGYYVSVIKPRGRTVLRVDQVTVSYSDMKRRMAYEYYRSPELQNSQTVGSVPSVTYLTLLAELTVITRAESELEVTIDDAELQKALRAKVGVAEGADDAAFAELYRRALANSHLHEDEFRQVVRAEELGKKVQGKLNENTPAQVPQAKVEVIQVAERAEAEAAIARVAAGEPWADVARDVSGEGDVAQTGGVKEFGYEGALPAAYDTFAFSAPIGEASTPLQDPSGDGPFYAVRVIERADMPLTDTQKPAFQAKLFRDWIKDTQAKMTIIDNWTTNDKARADALLPLYIDASAKQSRQIEEQQRPQPTIGVNLSTASATEGTPAPGTPASGTPPAAASTPAATAPADGQ
jgi:hypothetical protein